MQMRSVGRPVGCWIWFQFSVHTEDCGWLLFLRVYPLINTPSLYSILGYFGTLLYATELFFNNHISPKRAMQKKQKKMGWVLCVYLSQELKKKSALWNHDPSPWQMGLYISIVLSTNSLHFKRKLKKVMRKKTALSICPCCNTDTKNSILISSLIGNPCNPK